jgi:hypothetical protein
MGGPDSRGDVTLWLMVAAALVILIRRHRTA